MAIGACGRRRAARAGIRHGAPYAYGRAWPFVEPGMYGDCAWQWQGAPPWVHGHFYAPPYVVAPAAFGAYGRAVSFPSRECISKASPRGLAVFTAVRPQALQADAGAGLYAACIYCMAGFRALRACLQRERERQCRQGGFADASVHSPGWLLPRAFVVVRAGVCGLSYFPITPSPTSALRMPSSSTDVVT